MMTSFRFNFTSESSDNELSLDKTAAIQWYKSKKVLPDKQLKDFDEDNIRAKMFVCGKVEIGHVFVNTALARIKESDFGKEIELAEKAHSDLVTGTYEGGLKIWECTYDMIEFLEQMDINFENKNILDLGCGPGILGIYALIKGSTVTFQDYNKEVLEYVTIPNVLLNIDDSESELKKCTFYSGDWESFNNELSDSDIYDIIMTSETIYNESNYDKLINLFTKRLKKSGVVYLAAKTHYFGVGGGIKQFEQAMQNVGVLKSEIIWKSKDGIQRGILKITHNNP